MSGQPVVAIAYDKRGGVYVKADDGSVWKWPWSKPCPDPPADLEWAPAPVAPEKETRA
jgi:hypothetical protein